MEACCANKFFYQFDSQQEYEAFENDLDRQIYANRIEHLCGISHKGVSCLAYRCTQCYEIYLLSMPDHAWRGFYLPEEIATKHIATINRKDRMALYTGVVLFILFTLCVMLFLFGCNTVSKKQKVLIKDAFEKWRKEQITIGAYWANDSCNMQHFVNKPFDSLATIQSTIIPTPIGIPDSSEINFLYSDINNDGILDAIATFIPVQCDGGNFYKQEDEVFFLSTGTTYHIRLLSLSNIILMPNNAWSYYYSIDSLQRDSIYATSYGYADGDGNCCPSIIKHYAISTSLLLY